MLTISYRSVFWTGTVVLLMFFNENHGRSLRGTDPFKNSSLIAIDNVAVRDVSVYADKLVHFGDAPVALGEEGDIGHVNTNDHHPYHVSRTLFPATGRRTVLVLRVLLEDASPSVNVNDLYDRIFSATYSLKHLMYKCSASTLTLEPSTDRGVQSISVNGKIKDGLNRLIPLAEDAAAAQLNGGRNIRSSADHVIFVFPKIDNYVASAEIPIGTPSSGLVSYFSDEHAVSLSVLMHEIGHNFGLNHAYYNNNEYGDLTGQMGQSLNVRGDTPLHCFNPSNAWSLGWYPQGRQTISARSTPQTVTLSAFADYTSSNRKTVLLQVGSDIYMHYNRAKSHNSGTRAFRDSLVVTRNDGSRGTTLLAGLTRNTPAYSTSGINVRVCSVNSATDTMTVSIGTGRTDCSSQTGTPSSSIPSTTPSVLTWGESSPSWSSSYAWGGYSWTTPKSSSTSWSWTPRPSSSASNFWTTTSWGNGKVCLWNCE